MRRIDVPRIALVGASEGCGKSFLMLGLLQELRRRGVRVSVALTSSDLAQAGIYRRLTGRPALCLDPAVLPPVGIVGSLSIASSGSELVLIEGRRGVFDTTTAGQLSGCDAEILALTHTPVIFVADARGFGASLAALIKGFVGFSHALDFAGVIINRPDNATSQALMTSSLSAASLPTVLGVIPPSNLIGPTGNPQLTQIANPTVLERQFLAELGELVAEHVDIDQLLARAAVAMPLEFEWPESNQERRTRIAVSDDACFSLMYQDNLELLREEGAELVAMSPLADRAIPKNIGAIYLSGAYLGEYAPELVSNQTFIDSLQDFVEGGGALYAEGAATAWLGTSFRIGDNRFPGLGFIRAEGVASAPGVQVANGALLDHCLIGEGGDLIAGLMPTEWAFQPSNTAGRVLRSVLADGTAVLDGYIPRNSIFASFGLWHFGSNRLVAQSIVSAAAAFAPLRYDRE